jgi:hypothetical protein
MGLARRSRGDTRCVSAVTPSRATMPIPAASPPRWPSRRASAPREDHRSALPRRRQPPRPSGLSPPRPPGSTPQAAGRADGLGATGGTGSPRGEAGIDRTARSRGPRGTSTARRLVTRPREGGLRQPRSAGGLKAHRRGCRLAPYRPSPQAGAFGSRRRRRARRSARRAARGGAGAAGGRQAPARGPAAARPPWPARGLPRPAAGENAPGARGFALSESSRPPGGGSQRLHPARAGGTTVPHLSTTSRPRPALAGTHHCLRRLSLTAVVAGWARPSRSAAARRVAVGPGGAPAGRALRQRGALLRRLPGAVLSACLITARSGKAARPRPDDRRAASSCAGHDRRRARLDRGPRRRRPARHFRPLRRTLYPASPRPSPIPHPQTREGDVPQTHSSGGIENVGRRRDGARGRRALVVVSPAAVCAVAALGALEASAAALRLFRNVRPGSRTKPPRTARPDRRNPSETRSRRASPTPRTLRSRRRARR